MGMFFSENTTNLVCQECYLLVPFGAFVDGKMMLNKNGEIVESVWNDLPNHYAHVELDYHIIMPNHIHGIIIIVGAGPCACPDVGQPQGVAPTGLSLPDVVHRFKTITTKQYIEGVKQHGWSRFDGKLWQRNYYEHIVRNENELNQIRQYIADNPARWETDRNYLPNNIQKKSCN